MKIKIWLLLLTFLSLGSVAQNKKQFTLEDLIPGGSNFWALQPENLFTTWWGDCLVKTSDDSVQQLTDGKGKLVKPVTLFTLNDLNKSLEPLSDKAFTLNSVRFPYADKTLVILRTKKSRLLYDWKSKKIVWSAPLIEGSEHEDWNTASHILAFVKDHNLYVQNAAGKQLQVSTDGSRELVYGQSVHRDEFGISKGTYWSPSGNLLVFYRMDQSMVADYAQVDISTREATYVPDKYPMAGMTSHKVTVGIYNPATSKTIYLKAGDPTNRYFTNISWSPDEKTIYMIELPRTQDKAELVAYDVKTGERRNVLYTETNPKYVHPLHPIVFLPWDEHHFIYQSEKDGYNHLYLFSTDKGEERQLTQGKFVVVDMLGFDTKNKSVIITSTEASPIQNNLYSVSVATGKRTRLDDGTGVHRGDLSSTGHFVVDNYSAPSTPRVINVVNTQNGQTTPLLKAADPWRDYEVPEISSGTIKAADGNTDLYYRLIKPTHFDPNKKYPTVVYVYGGPGVRNVEASRNFATRGWEIYMAQRGYVVFVLDNRGSSDRGFAFESCTFHHLGREEMKDQICGVNYLKSLPYVDSTRMGIHGWSFGGFMTTSLMCNYPHVFKVGVAGGPVIDWKYYEVMYGERYMGTPEINPDGFHDSSLLPKAGNLKGRLQIILGYNDPTVVPQNTLAFLRSSIDAGTQPDLFIYPGDGHNMFGRDRVHLHERITRYFDDYLK